MSGACPKHGCLSFQTCHASHVILKIMYNIVGIPQPTTFGPSDDDDDVLVGSGSGSGSGATTDSTPNEKPPSLVVFERNQTILINTATTSRIFINVTYEPGTPRGLLAWRHEGAIISSRTDSRVSILGNGGLTIRNIRPADRGLYSVEVSNRVGIDSANFTILLECEYCNMHVHV